MNRNDWCWQLRNRKEERKITYNCVCYSLVSYSFWSLFLFSPLSAWQRRISLSQHIYSSRSARQMSTDSNSFNIFVYFCFGAVSLSCRHSVACVRERWECKQTCFDGVKKTNACANSRPQSAEGFANEYGLWWNIDIVKSCGWTKLFLFEIEFYSRIRKIFEWVLAIDLNLSWN